MTEAPISPLRRRMIEDMTMRKFAPRTQEGYIRAVKGFSAFLGASPDTASFEDLRRYQLHLVSTGTAAPTINHTTTARRFLFMVTLRRPELVAYLPFVREPRRLPVVLSPEEGARLLNAAPGLKYKAALSIAYGAGLRACEIISLKLGDIDSARMVIRVKQGKSLPSRKRGVARACPRESGGPLRHAVRAPARTPARMVEGGEAPGLAVSGQNPVNPLTPRQLNRACHAAARMAEIDKPVHLHTLRQCFATHLLEQKTDIRVIQSLPPRRRGYCSGTRSSIRRRSTRASPSRRWARSPARSSISPKR
jgi:integrase/recombinase XerD